MTNKIRGSSTAVFSAVHILIHLAGFATGISLKNVSIPHYGVKEGSIGLFCDFDIEADHLLDLKWYKNEEEFFRYSPTASPHIATFGVDGVSVDVPHSSLKLVTLKNITLRTSGLYKCEILADKSFRTLSDQGYMIVIAPPQDDPEILLESNRGVSVGERVRGNCTSYRSKPAASLMFYINGQKPDFSDITEYLPMNETGGLETSKLGFNFLVEPHHLSNQPRIELKCTATIGNYYAVTRRSLPEARITAQPSSEMNQLSSGCSRAGLSTLTLFSTYMTLRVMPTFSLISTYTTFHVR